jgi:hypothetical protein
MDVKEVSAVTDKQSIEQTHRVATHLNDLLQLSLRRFDLKASVVPTEIHHLSSITDIKCTINLIHFQNKSKETNRIEQ